MFVSFIGQVIGWLFLMRNVFCLLGICYIILSLENCGGIMKYLDGNKYRNEVKEICSNQSGEPV